MSTLRRILGVATVVDDRARPIEILPSPEMLALLSRWQRLMLWRWAMPAYVVLVVLVLIPLPWLICPLVGVSLVFMPLGIGSRSRRLAALSRAALAAGACGGCGYRIEDRHVAKDGLRVCPECGGAWLANAPTPQDVLVPFTFQRHYRGWYRVIRWGMPTIRDDRGQILPQRVTGPWAPMLDARAARRAGSQVTLAAALLWAGVALACVVLISIFGQYAALPVGVVGMIVIAVGTVAIGILYARALQIGRRDALGVCACPACGTDLSNSSTESDGCAKCPSCWAAWRATDIQRPMAPPPQEA